MDSLHLLQQCPDLWRGKELPPGLRPGLPSGFAELDAVLPGGGWPRGALIEILYGPSGSGELELLMPALARLSREARWVVWIAPPYLPYAPALAGRGVDLLRLLIVRPENRRDGLWTLEQALRSGACSLVLAWLDRLQTAQLRRLQLAAETGRTTGVLLRPMIAAAEQAQTAALRLKVQPVVTGMQVDILRCRGSWVRGPLQLELPRLGQFRQQPNSSSWVVADNH